MALGQLLQGLDLNEEVESHDLEASSGTNYINENGIFPVTIEKAFMTETKKGGVQLDVHFGGGNTINIRMFIVSVGKDGKRTTTCKMQGKTVSLPDFKLMKQLYFVATGEGKDLGDIKTKVETIKYKEYGEDIEVEAETIIDLIGKQVNIAIRLEEEYNYEDGEVDKTSLKVDSNGNTRYKKTLDDVYSSEGLHAIEIIKKSEPKLMKAKEAFLLSDKGIKRVKLELPEIEDEDGLALDDDEEINF